MKYIILNTFYNNNIDLIDEKKLLEINNEYIKNNLNIINLNNKIKIFLKVDNMNNEDDNLFIKYLFDIDNKKIIKTEYENFIKLNYKNENFIHIKLCIKYMNKKNIIIKENDINIFCIDYVKNNLKTTNLSENIKFLSDELIKKNYKNIFDQNYLDFINKINKKDISIDISKIKNIKEII